MSIFFVLDGLRMEPTTESAGQLRRPLGGSAGMPAAALWRRYRVRGPQLRGRSSSGSRRSSLSAQSFIELSARLTLGRKLQNLARWSRFRMISPSRESPLAADEDAPVGADRAGALGRRPWAKPGPVVRSAPTLWCGPLVVRACRLRPHCMCAYEDEGLGGAQTCPRLAPTLWCGPLVYEPDTSARDTGSMHVATEALSAAKT